MLKLAPPVPPTPATWTPPDRPRPAAFTTTKVPKFSGLTSCDHYRQVFDAIVRSNGWEDATVTLQLLSHVEGDALKDVALLVPEPTRVTQIGLVGALTDHYGSPGRLADCQRYLGDMGPNARTRIIRDRFIAGHLNSALRRHLDSLPPETPIREIVDRCKVWQSHADTDDRRVVKPMLERVQLMHAVSEPTLGPTEQVVAAVTGPSLGLADVEAMLKHLPTAIPAQAPPPLSAPSDICIATPKDALPLRSMYCHREICIATPKYTLPLQNISCHSEICIATPKYALPLRNMHFHNKICFATPKLRHMLCHSEICFATPKYALLPRKNAIPLKCYILTNSIPILRHMLCHPKYALPLRNMHCYPEKNAIPLKFYILTHSLPIKHSRHVM